MIQEGNYILDENNPILERERTHDIFETGNGTEESNCSNNNNTIKCFAKENVIAKTKNKLTANKSSEGR